MSHATAEEMQLAIERHIESLRQDLPREHALRSSLHQQIEVILQQLGDTPVELVMANHLLSTMQVIDGIPVTQPDSIPQPWEDFKPVASAVESGVGQVSFTAADSGTRVEATCWLCRRGTRRDLVVTNSHFLDKAAQAEHGFPPLREEDIPSIRVTFDGQPNQHSTHYQALALYRHPTRDLAVIQIEDVADGIPALPLATSTPADDSKVIAVGYPGLPAAHNDFPLPLEDLFPYPSNRRVISPGRVLDVRGFQVWYNCTLAPGSSGSPIFDADHNVTAVHYWGQHLISNYGIRVAELSNLLDDEGL